MSSSIFAPITSNILLKPNLNSLVPSNPSLPNHLPYARRRVSLTTKALLSTTKETVLKDFHERRALKVLPYLNVYSMSLLLSRFRGNWKKYECLQNLNWDNVASVVTAADKGGATHVDIACDPELVKLATSLTSLPVCVSSVDPEAFLAAVEAGALMVEIGNYDSFYEMGVIFSPEQILSLTKETNRILPSVKLAEQLEQEGASPTLAAAYSISRAVKIPVMCSSGLSAVTAPMAITAGAAGVGVGSAVNKLNDVVAMIAEVRSLADSLNLSTGRQNVAQKKALRL
ncbi:hypothetical protein RJ639_036743 [Escallonia herrerae]|uniref:Uncharacterized protein ycf23 n=1 Tax=Escallonia herrerae TaxID=1293975 RepID=A0AA88WT31_9ASTE|nr:hypothetical protein RJ639_036743 [Escallonia herrerae]